jgi:hypothetical protein
MQWRYDPAHIATSVSNDCDAMRSAPFSSGRWMLMEWSVVFMFA